MTLYLSNRDGNGKTSEEGHYKFQTSVFTGSTLGSNDLKVTQNSPTGMSVLVEPGQFRIETTGDYAYTGWNSSNTVVAISTADPANPRITSVVLYIDKGAATSASPVNNPGIPKLTTVDGTPAGSPTAPSGGTIQTAIGAGNPYIILANITVAASDTTIITADISDQRSQVTILTDLVANASLRDNSVSTVKVQDSAITNAKLADNSITSTKLADGSISIIKISNAYQFSAYRSGAHGSGTIVYNIENFDTNSNYDTSTGRYTAPVNGFYQFNVNSHQQVTAAPQDPESKLIKNGATELAYSHFVNMYNGGSSGSANFSVLVQLNAGDYVHVTCSRALDVSTPGRNNFSGFLASPN